MKTDLDNPEGRDYSASKGKARQLNEEDVSLALDEYERTFGQRPPVDGDPESDTSTLTIDGEDDGENLVIHDVAEAPALLPRPFKDDLELTPAVRSDFDATSTITEVDDGEAKAILSNGWLPVDECPKDGYHVFMWEDGEVEIGTASWGHARHTIVDTAKDGQRIIAWLPTTAMPPLRGTWPERVGSGV